MTHRRAQGLGEWNTECAICGFEMSSAKLRQNWKGFYCCPDCWEAKPEVYDLRPKLDRQTVPWVQKSKDRSVDPLTNYGENIASIFHPTLKDD